MNYYDEIKQKLIDNEIYGKVKDYSKERHNVITYYEVGRLLFEAGSVYGEDIIGKYSEKLITEVGKKYNRRTLFRMRQFYKMFSDEKVSPLVTQLSWTHYVILLSLNDYDKINYYINQVLNRNLSKRQLQDAIKNKEYERLPLETRKKLIAKEESKVEDFIKNPILIKNRHNYTEVSEKALQRLILDDIESFMKELGNNFCFIGSEYKIKIGNQDNYIDLLLYNIKFKAYVVIELKVTPLKKEHIGQIQTYMNYVNKNIKTIEENPTIGIIICKRENHFVMEYCSDEGVLTREYEIVK